MSTILYRVQAVLPVVPVQIQAQVIQNEENLNVQEMQEEEGPIEIESEVRFSLI